MRSILRVSLGSVGLAALTIMGGCVGDDLPASRGEGTGLVRAAVTNAPADAACLQIAIAGPKSSTASFALMPGASTVLSVGPLAAGSTTLSASAYNVACSAVRGATVPTWLADPVSVLVRPGLTTDVTLTLHPNSAIKTTVDFVVPAVAVSAGYGFSLALLSDGTVRAWGNNFDGELGAPPDLVGMSSAPRPVPGIAGATQVSAGTDSACALLGSGKAKCWGQGADGALGDGKGISSATPVDVAMPAGVTFTQISVGFGHACAVGSDLSAYCWGANDQGQLGDATTLARLSPQRVFYTRGVAEVRAGGARYSCLRDVEGNTRCFGNNRYNQFGNNTPADEANAFPNTSVFHAAVALATGDSFTCVLRPLGAMECGGYCAVGQCGEGFGDGDGGYVFPKDVDSVRIRTTALLTFDGVTQMSAGVNSTCALRSDSTVWCWGSGVHGQLGVGDAIDRKNSALQVLGISDATSVAVGAEHACAVRADGTIACWGLNSTGQLGDGSFEQRYVPTKTKL